MAHDDATDTWITIARGLVAVAVLSIAAEVVTVFGDTGASLSNRVYQVSESASALVGLFALVAVLVLLLSNTPTQRSRGVLTVAQSIGVLMLVCAVYAASYSLTVHSQFPQTDQSTTFLAVVGLNWSYRLGGVLRAVASAIVGALTIFAVRSSGRRARLAALDDLGEMPTEHE